MLTRALSGLVFIVLVSSAILYSSWTLGLLFVILTVLGMSEFFGLYKVSKAQVVPSIFIGLLTYTLLFLHANGEMDPKYFLFLIPAISMTYVIELYRKEKHALENMSVNLWSVIYVAIPFGLLNYLGMYTGEYKGDLPMGILLIIWSSDTFAYLSGSFLGKHKLFKSISPKKSWEGYFGGLVFSLITAYLVSILFDTYSVTNWLVIGAIVGTVGTWGDLIESLIKRSAGVKDSGNIMPGHGGILDRFDTLLFVVPLVYFYLKIWGV